MTQPTYTSYTVQSTENLLYRAGQVQCEALGLLWLSSTLQRTFRHPEWVIIACIGLKRKKENCTQDVHRRVERSDHFRKSGKFFP